ncbi:HD domain-containing protein [Aliarcobacter lanthieri]|uniref:HD domain-containing protein n=1 Tax=Aliarcobacter lanthieri TaxID=1355374 RepID=UPI00047D9407|nr:hypothetical protein [Aliarcobacter lanthieri]
MWTETDIEKHLNEKIKESSGSMLNSNSYLINYNTVKDYFIREVYPNISKIEPQLTDHGEVHIQNVLQNAYDLIKQSNTSLSGLELYVLCMSILVHDIGNLSGREGHEGKLKEYFNSDTFSTLDKKHIILISQIAKSHGGKDCDTIEKITSKDLDGKEIKAQKIAAILRFADELAEGTQRTSMLMLEKDFIEEENKMYHIYASILNRPAIIKDTITLNYSIYLDNSLVNDLEKLLVFIHKRVQKVYNELLYCGHYCDDISSIKKISVTISLFENKKEFDPLSINNQLLKFELSGQSVHCSKNFDFESNYFEIMKHIETLNIKNEDNNTK